jgi:hypothetical protein
MAISPFAAMDAQREAQRSAPAPNPAIQLPQPRAPLAVTLQDTPLEGGTIPMAPGLQIANVTQPMPPGARSTGTNLGPQGARSTGTNLGPQGAHPLGPPSALSTGNNLGPGSSPSPVLGAMPGSYASPPVPVPARRSRVGLVLFLLLLLLGGAGAGLYFYGDRVGVNLGSLGR